MKTYNEWSQTYRCVRNATAGVKHSQDAHAGESCIRMEPRMARLGLAVPVTIQTRKLARQDLARACHRLGSSGQAGRIRTQRVRRRTIRGMLAGYRRQACIRGVRIRLVERLRRWILSGAAVTMLGNCTSKHSRFLFSFPSDFGCRGLSYGNMRSRVAISAAC